MPCGLIEYLLVRSPLEALGEASQTVTLGPNEYFLVGDHLPQSVDSRQAGPVPLELFLGPVRRASD